MTPKPQNPTNLKNGWLPEKKTNRWGYYLQLCWFICMFNRSIHHLQLLVHFSDLFSFPVLHYLDLIRQFLRRYRACWPSIAHFPPWFHSCHCWGHTPLCRYYRRSSNWSIRRPVLHWMLSLLMFPRRWGHFLWRTFHLPRYSLICDCPNQLCFRSASP